MTLAPMILLLLAVPIIAIAALAKSIGLGWDLRRLNARLAALERGLAAAAPQPEATQPAPTPVSPSKAFHRKPNGSWPLQPPVAPFEFVSGAF